MSRIQQEAFIVAATRSPIGKAPRGMLRHTRPDDLLVAVLKSALAQAPGLDPALIEDAIVGCSFPEAEQGLNLARMAVLLAGLPKTVGGATVNRYCASGLTAVAMAADRIRCGEADVMIAAGAESMSMVPMMGHWPSINPDALLDENIGMAYGMGLTAEKVAEQWKVSRADQDAFALQSHQRAMTRDEGARADTNLEALAKLRPVFAPKGSVTAGNSSQTSDGAGALILVSEDVLRRENLTPLARFVSFSVRGVPPEIMGIGPKEAIPAALKSAGLSKDQIEWIELNEAFAAQSLAVMRDLDLDPARVNPNGGAIALGHPLGATGAIRSATVVHALRRHQLKYGMVTMCVGTGMGAAGIFERV
jgi:acetyl-CoA acyltransferase